MSKVSCAMVRPILETMYNHRTEMVPCFIGDPGIGKTQGLYEFAKDKGVNVVTFILSNTVPSEISGIRMPDKESKHMEVFDDMRMASLKDGDILFFDEILEAPPMLWSACLTLIQDRIMASGRKLPDVFIVAASNPVASPGIIPASTRDRFMFIELSFSGKYWCEWFMRKYKVDPSDLISRIEGDSDQYNILTPRRVEKLFTWLKVTRDNQNREAYEIAKGIVSAMFDGEICRRLVNMLNQSASPQRQIKEALESMDIEGIEDLIEDFDELSLKNIMELLQEQPEWEMIQTVLASTEFIDNKEELEDIQF